MDIKRVDDKHMDIHKKQESKLHLKENSKVYAKKFMVQGKEVAKGVGIAGEKKVVSNIEGGEEIEESLYLGNLALEPMKKTASRSKQMLRKRFSNEAKKIKKVEKGKKLARKNAKKASKKIAKNVIKKTAKTTAKQTGKAVAKETTKVAVEVGTTVAGTAAGTAGAGPYGPLIGIAAGEAVGIKMDIEDAKATRRMRMFKYFQDKLSGDSTSHDSLGKMLRDVAVTYMMLPLKYIAKYALISLLIIVLLVAAVAIPVVAVVRIIYNSPFAIFLPPLEPGDTVATVTTQYMADFNREISTLASEHNGCSTGKIVYVDYEGTSATPSNYYDVMCVYMVKYGFENTATVMDETSKQNLKLVFDDMCSYTTSQTTEKINGSNQKVLNVNVVLKSYKDMSTVYSFTEEQVEVLNQMMSADGLAQLGYIPASGGGTGMTNAKNSLSSNKVKSIVDKITDEKAKTACSYALARVGYPYSQTYRDSGSYYDCSSLAFYSWQSAGVNISYDGANYAAAEAKWCDENKKNVSESDLKPGDLIFYSYSNNRRYKNISHVGIYVGDGKMVEAVDEATGVVICDYHNKNMVLIGRPNKK